jgi:hypothetical protein
MDRLDLANEVRNLADKAKGADQDDAAVVLFCLSGCLRLAPAADRELARICGEFARSVLREMGNPE